MANYAKTIVNARNLIGKTTVLVFNPGAHMTGKIRVTRQSARTPSYESGGICPSPKTPQNSAPDQYCPPLYTTSAVSLNPTVGDMQGLFNIIIPADFGPINIPVDISSSCPATSSQKAGVANFLHQHYSNASLAIGETGLVFFADGSRTVFQVVNPGTHQFAAVQNANFGADGTALQDDCQVYPIQPNPVKTPSLPLPSMDGLTNINIGGGLGASDLGGFFNAPAVTFSGQNKGITRFTGSHIRKHF